MARLRIPLAQHWSETAIARVLGPMQEFVHRSASGGIVLMVAAVVALVLANSPLAEAYDALLHTEIGVTAGGFELKETLLHWINDGLMAIFFFLVGLEIKREVRAGELSDPRAALLPIIAACGGAVIPALIFVAINAGSAGARGWGIPMATDIAFALGLLALLGNRIPFSLKIFLTAVAIVDDLIAVLVIAIFYSSGINVVALGIGFAFLCLLLLANIFGIRHTLVYTLVGLVVWLAFLKSGVHATIAGVLIAWTVPARNQIDLQAFVEQTHAAIHRLQGSKQQPSPMLTHEEQQSTVLELEDACEKVQAPLQKLEHSLHTPVSFLIMPIFALANAGVALSPASLAAETSAIPLGIIAGLVIGKPMGLLGAAWLATRFGLVALPHGVRWQHMIGASFLAGVGFTMSLFIATLGYTSGERLEAAKLGILTASVIAGSVGYIWLRRLPAPEAD